MRDSIRDDLARRARGGGVDGGIGDSSKSRDDATSRRLDATCASAHGARVDVYVLARGSIDGEKFSLAIAPAIAVKRSRRAS